MKKKLISFLAVCILIIVYACETAMPTFNDPECGLRFVQADATRGYTFLYDAPDTKELLCLPTLTAVNPPREKD